MILINQIISDLIPEEGSYPPAIGYQEVMHTLGPMTRYASDLVIALRVLADKEKLLLLKLHEKVY